MGTITKNYAEQGSGTGAQLATHTFTFTRDNINVVDTEYINYPTLELTTSVKYNISSGGRTAIYDYGQFELRASNPQGTVNTIGRFGYSTDIRTLSANVAYTQTTNRDGYANSYTGASFFSSANPTVREVDIHLISKYLYIETGYPASGGIAVVGSGSYTTETDLGVIGKIVFNRPPTFTASALTIDTTSAYTNITTASVSISNLSAKLGGTIASATLTIGNQSVSRTDNGTLSILLNQGGTFTPTLTVTDSRGVSATQTFDNLVVNVYSQPTVSFDVERTTSTGTPDDEGAYATVDATLTFADAIADAVTPTIVVTDNDGITQTVSTTWYSTRASDGTLSGSVTWANLSSGDTVYGLVSITGGFDTQKSYQIELTPEDSQSTGTTITQTLGSAFYTVDFLAGGHGIAFGKPAINTGFECAMDATFEETLTAQDMTAQEVDDFVDNIGGGGSAFADKVVEQGTSGIWTYRKWASGIAECWGTVRTTTSFSAWTSPIYYGTTYVARQNFPTGLFIDTPNEFVNIYSAGAFDAWAGSDSTNRVSATQSGRYYPLRVGSGSSGDYITQFYEVGRWK